MKFAAVFVLVPWVALAQQQLMVVSAASYRPAIAPGSLASAFASGLPQEPVVLVEGQNSQVLFASASQINFLVPPGVAPGRATVEVRNGSEVAARGTVEVAPSAPSLFSASATGRGVAAGRAILIAADGTQTAQELAGCTPQGCTVRLVPTSGVASVILELYGTGIRGSETITATANGLPVEVLYAGEQSQYVGLDQVNVRIPGTLLNAGVTQVQVNAGGYANVVAVQVGGPEALPAPTVLFDPASPSVGPFPTDLLTVSDANQKTGRRVQLPLPDCAAEPTACQTIALLNEYDGFGVEPRFQVRFSAPVDPETLKGGLGIVWLDNLAPDEPGLKPRGALTRLNRGIIDPLTHTYYAETDEPLDQHRRYALVVTSAVEDAVGRPLQADPRFTACASAPSTPYCGELAAVLPYLRQVTGRTVIAASLFTTQSATSWLEKARSLVLATPPNIQRGLSVELGKFDILTLRLHTGVNPDRFEDTTLPAATLTATGLSRLVFGSFDSPNFFDARNIITNTPTGPAVPLQRGTSRVGYHVFLPSGTAPAAGFPVVIFGHGLGDSAFGAPTLVAGSLVREGFAVAIINAAGHGGGPLTNLVLAGAQNAVVPVPGRGEDLNGDNQVGAREGCLLETLGIAVRDCLRQTAVDLMQLVRIARDGIDLDGDGQGDLDGSRVYYAGQSLGALYGTLLSAVEPAVRASVLNVGGGSVADAAILSDSFRDNAREILADHVPSLLNDGSDFNSNYVLRDQPVRLNDVSGAMEIQNYLDLLEWLHMPGDPIGFAPHLSLSPLPGVPPKRVLFQIARGDRTVPNPANSNLIRHAGAYDSTVLYRHDTARSIQPSLAENPHAFLVDIRSVPALAIAASAQQQMAGFLWADGQAIPNANTVAVLLLFRGNALFEQPPSVLPETPGFTP